MSSPLTALKHERGALMFQLRIETNTATKEVLRDRIAELTKVIVRLGAVDPISVVGDCPHCSLPILNGETKCSWCKR